ncbi:M20 family metallopeptidase [Orrella sp. JC864]|uniref:M20 family metallopeptidase n=1 Tax=Orrella sp. JC864 TaxID=3120298 RepID=UPI00300A488D
MLTFPQRAGLVDEVMEWLQSSEAAMIDMLRRMVDTDSGSYDKPGVDAVGRIVCEFLHSQGIAWEVLPSDTLGDAIRACIGSVHASPYVLLMGHRDTVFKQGEAARRPFRVDERGIAYGPGVADMKAGLVMNTFVMAALARAGADLPLVSLYTGDEEIASPFSRAIIERNAQGASAVFNAEPGRVNGNVVTGRKGCIFGRFEVSGTAAHSGANFPDGISAIEEICRKTVALHALTDLPAGVTVNVGLISGGLSVNTIAPQAQAELDLRYIDPDSRDILLGRIRDIMDQSFVPGTRARFEISGEFLPLVPDERSTALFEHYVACARHCGLSVGGEFTGGSADSGFAAAAGAPTLCATGPLGAKVHSVNEYMQLDSMVPRAKALALSILTLPR